MRPALLLTLCAALTLTGAAAAQFNLGLAYSTGQGVGMSH